MEGIHGWQKLAAARVKGCEETLSTLQSKVDGFEDQLEQIVAVMVELDVSLEQSTELDRKCVDERDTARLQIDLMERVHRRLKADLGRLTAPGRSGGPRPEIEQLQRTEHKLQARMKFWEMTRDHAMAPTDKGEQLVKNARLDCYFSDPELAEIKTLLLQISKNANLSSFWRSSIF